MLKFLVLRQDDEDESYKCSLVDKLNEDTKKNCTLLKLEQGDPTIEQNLDMYLTALRKPTIVFELDDELGGLFQQTLDDIKSGPGGKMAAHKGLSDDIELGIQDSAECFTSAVASTLLKVITTMFPMVLSPDKEKTHD